MKKRQEKIIILGGGGHARVLIDLIRTSGKYEIAGILDLLLEQGIKVLGISVLGKDDLLPEFYKRGIKNVCIGVGSIKDNNNRKKIYEKVKQIGFHVPFLIHPKAIISGDTKISEGVQIMAGATIQTGCVIGENTIINTGAIVEHDCSVGRDVHICPGSVISGECTVSDGVFVGAGATVIQGIKIGKGVLVGAGAVVIRDVQDNVKVMGIPAK